VRVNTSRLLFLKMTKLLWSTRECVAFDQHLQLAFGIPASLLMENAASGVAAFCIKLATSYKFTRVLCLAGPGHNGADALIAARHLSQSALAPSIGLFELAQPSHGGALSLRDKALQTSALIGIPHLNGPFSAEFLSNHFDLILDGLFGLGLNRPISGYAFSLIQSIQASGLPVVAVDCPSGLNCDSGEAMGICLPATWTLTFVGPKIGFYTDAGSAYCGQVQSCGIGVSDALANDWLLSQRKGTPFKDGS
jgi:hydroxyethylthiazole kinase-like uncharacterized protein yjeF